MAMMRGAGVRARRGAGRRIMMGPARGAGPCRRCRQPSLAAECRLRLTIRPLAPRRRLRLLRPSRETGHLL